MCNVYGTWGAGSLSYVCVACWQGLGGAGDRSLSVRAKMPVCPLLPAPLQAPGCPCPCPGRCRLPLPLQHGPAAGGGQHGPGEGGAHLGSLSRRDPCSLGHLQCPCTHRIAQIYPTHSPCITFWGDPGMLPWPQRCDMGQSTLSMLLATEASMPSPAPCSAAEPPVGLDKTRCQPLLGVWLEVTVMVAGPRAPAGTAEAGGHPTALPQCVGTPGCHDVLHLWGWGEG